MTTHPIIAKPGGAVTVNGATVASELPRPTRYTESTYSSLVEKPLPVTVTECVEGKIVRLFSVDGVWYVAGAARVDTFDRFCTQQTGQLFCECTTAVFGNQPLVSLLNPNVGYVFLLRPFGQLVCAVEPDLCRRLILIATEHPVGTFDYSPTELPELARRQQHCVNPTDDLLRYLKANLLPTRVQGIVVNETIKILFDDYVKLKQLRGTCRTLRQRYLELRCTPQLPEFLANFSVDADSIEESLYAVARRLHPMYLKLYVSKEPVSCSSNERQVLQAVHKAYLATKQRTTPSKINDLLAQLPALKLERLMLSLT